MPSDDLERELADNLDMAVRCGRHDYATIVAEAVEDFVDAEADRSVLAATVRRLAGPRFAAHREAQDGWPERTDNDRLTDAFRALDEAGVVAREDFTCCQNCGVAEIADEGAGRGYAFYHQQDTERAARSGSLWTAFGPTVEIGAEVADAIRAQGLHVDWDGSAGQRLHVRMRWTRRRHGRMAAYPSGPGLTEIEVEVVKGRHRLPASMPDADLEQLELPWLPAGVALRLADEGRAVVVHREHDRLVSDDGRNAGRFHGLRLLREVSGPEPVTPESESGLLEVTFQSLPTGPQETAGRPMTVAEAVDVLRRLPTRTGSWLCAVSRSDKIVQMRWEDARLWLETPDVEREASIGKHARLDEAELMLAVLAAEDRVAVGELEGVTVKPW